MRIQADGTLSLYRGLLLPPPRDYDGGSAGAAVAAGGAVSAGHERVVVGLGELQSSLTEAASAAPGHRTGQGSEGVPAGMRSHGPVELMVTAGGVSGGAGGRGVQGKELDGSGVAAGRVALQALEARERERKKTDEVRNLLESTVYAVRDLCEDAEASRLCPPRVVQQAKDALTKAESERPAWHARDHRVVDDLLI